MLLLMAQILHQLIGSFFPIILHGFIHAMLVILTMGKLGYIHLVITGVIILPTQKMHYLREIPQNYHTFALLDSPQMGNLMISGSC